PEPADYPAAGRHVRRPACHGPGSPVRSDGPSDVPQSAADVRQTARLAQDGLHITMPWRVACESDELTKPPSALAQTNVHDEPTALEAAGFRSGRSGAPVGRARHSVSA